MIPLEKQIVSLGLARRLKELGVRQESLVAQGCFCDPHMQEPNIPPLFQTISKAESPLSFLETKHPPRPFPITSVYRELEGVDNPWLSLLGKERKGGIFSTSR